MKILQVVHQFPPEHIGGTEVYVQGLARELSQRGHKVTVFAGADAEEDREWEGLQIRTVRGGLNNAVGPVKTFLNTFSNRLTEEHFRRLCHEQRPDIVHFHHLLGLSARLVALAQQLSLPTLVTLHDYWFACSNAQLITPAQKICSGSAFGLNCALCATGRLGKPYLAILAPLLAPLFLYRDRTVWSALQRTDVVIAPSNFIAEFFIKRGLPDHKVIRSALGIDLSAVKPTSPKPCGDRIRFAYIGSIAWQKGVHVLVEAFNAVDPQKADLQIYGDETIFPEYARGLRQRTENSNIHFCGKLAHNKLGQVLAEIDALVVPSLWYENAPVIIAEAFAAGVPIIASRRGALEEWVKDGENGLLFKPGVAEDLRSKINQILENRELLARLATQIPKIKSVGENATELEAIYQNLVASKRAGVAKQLANRILDRGV